jgi:hypothetical protein
VLRSILDWATSEELEHNERALSELARVVASGEAILLAGAGSSISAGYPSWDALLQRLCYRCRELGASSSARAPSDEVAKLRYAQELREEITRIAGPDAYHRVITHAFSAPPIITSFHRDLVRLPFRAFLTTNYDEVLEEAFEAVGSGRPKAVAIWNGDQMDVSPAIRAIAVGGPIEYVIHLHGVYRFAASVILCADDYRRAYGFALPPERANGGRQTPLVNLTTALLATRRIVFVGFSVRDAFFAEVLQRVSDDMIEWRNSIHFAVSSRSAGSAADDRQYARRLKERLGIETVFYIGSGDDHTARDRLVARLSRLVSDELLREHATVRVGVGGMPPQQVPEWVRRTNEAARNRIESL